MSSQRVRLIDPEGNVVAAAQVTDQGDCFAGVVDLRRAPATVRQQFEEYEEIVNNQLFGLLDEIEQKIGALLLRVVFEDGHEADLADVQIYPSAKKVSFKLKEAARAT